MCLGVHPKLLDSTSLLKFIELHTILEYSSNNNIARFLTDSFVVIDASPQQPDGGLHFLILGLEETF
ncbi:hypothetical protein Sjap_020306 [Stephania japonica]|uniref:Uncharacterized protein n=1 Tax=Stephania japonica TaxID=461633 RepID=A0AAP0F5Y8_9MAGN